MDVFVAERAMSPSDDSLRYVVIDGAYRVHTEASAYLAALRALDRSPNTERVYASRIALFLSYCGRFGFDWQKIQFSDLARFLRWLVAEPLPPRRPSSPTRFRSAGTANAVMTSVCEFLRFAAAHGWVSSELIPRLSHRKDLRYLPGHDSGEMGQFASIRAKSLKLTASVPEIEFLTARQVDELIAAAARTRDRFLITLMALTGIRVGEALGLRREDLHLLPRGALVGCSTDGPHIHVRRRCNANGALAKSRYPRSIPVMNDLVGLYAQYQHERFAVAGAMESDLVFVNLYHEPIGDGMRYGNVRSLFARLSAAAGFTARPHMLRHTAATRWIENGVPRDVVQHLLGHVSSVSMDPYLHPPETAKRAAVERVAARLEGYD